MDPEQIPVPNIPGENNFLVGLTPEQRRVVTEQSATACGVSALTPHGDVVTEQSAADDAEVKMLRDADVADDDAGAEVSDFGSVGSGEKS